MLAKKWNLWQRIQGEVSQIWAIVVKDIRIYYATPAMIMFGILTPFFLFFSFSVKRDVPESAGLARFLAMTIFFSASSAGPVIIPMERRDRSFDRLLSAPMSLFSLLFGKTLVGAIFGFAIFLLTLVIGALFLRAHVADVGLLFLTSLLSSLAFAALGIFFGSFPSQSPGNIMMPSTLLRWPLLFISGVFIPLSEMAPWTRALSYLSPLTYSQDLLNYAVVGSSVQPLLLNITALALSSILFLLPAMRMHILQRKMGY